MKGRSEMKNPNVLWIVLAVLVLATVGCSAMVHRSTAPSELPAMIGTPDNGEKTAAPKKEIAKTDFSKQPKISNLWEGTDIKTVLQDCAVQSGFNILSDDTVQGTVNLKIENVPLEQALRMILSPLGYVFRKIDTYYLVGSGIPGSPGALELSQAEEVVTNRPAEEVVALLSSGLALFVKAAKGGYSLSINAPPEIIERIKSDINNLDTPEQLVQIEVLVTEVRHNKGLDVGVDWSQVFNITASG